MKTSNISANILKSVFSDPEQESFLCAAGERQLLAYSASRRIKKSFVAVSDKNVYFFGKNFRFKDGRIRKNKSNQVLPLSSLHRISILRMRPGWLLGLCFFFLVLAPIMALLELVADLGTYTVLSPLLDAVLCLIFAAICWLLYSAAKKRLVTFTFGEGIYAIDTQHIPEREESALIHKLRSHIAQAYTPTEQ